MNGAGALPYVKMNTCKCLPFSLYHVLTCVRYVADRLAGCSMVDIAVALALEAGFPPQDLSQYMRAYITV